MELRLPLLIVTCLVLAILQKSVALDVSLTFDYKCAEMLNS